MGLGHFISNLSFLIENLCGVDFYARVELSRLVKIYKLMAKQYLFFKLCPEPINYVPADRLFNKELSGYFNSLHRIETVFELNRFAEIRQLIEKDIYLQKHITHSLPDSGIHGYLAIIDTMPPIEKMVKCLALCDEFILFQRSHEPKDTYLRYLAGSNISKQIQVYNWHIFIVPTLNAFNCSISTILTGEYPPEKTDKLFLKPDIIFHRGFQNHPDPLHDSHHTLDPLNRHTSRLSAAITNILSQDCVHFTDLSATSSHMLRHASITGIPVSGVANTYLATIETQMRTQFILLDIPVLQTAIDKFNGLLGQLLDEPRYRQSHLFQSDIDHAFKLFESKILVEHGDIKSYKRHLKLFRNIIAARFLIDHEYITHDKSINLFLSFNLLQTIFIALQNKTLIPFSSLIEKNADKLLSEMYICQKTRELFGIRPSLSNIIPEITDVPRTSTGRQAFFIKLPENNAKNSRIERNYINIAMNLYQSKFLKDPSPEISADIRNEYAHKIRANRYLRDKLDFYRTFLSREEYLSLTNQCVQLFYSIDLVLNKIKPGDRLGMLSPIQYHYVDDSPHEFAFPEVITEYLDSHPRFNYQSDYKMRIDSGTPYLKQQISIVSSIS